MRPHLKKLHRYTQALGDDARGATALMFAFCLVPLIGFTGLAVDGGRAYWARSQLISAVDVAALAGARKFRTAADITIASDAAQNYFNANFTATTKQVSVVSLTRVGAITAHGVEYTVVGTIKAKTLFMQLFGYNDITMQADAKAVRSDGKMEIVLALDNTGSMGIDSGSGVSRIQALKDASASLIDGIYGSTEDTDNIHIGVIPYTSQVNVGKLVDPAFVKQMPGYTDNADPALGWKGCVDADSTNNNVTAADGNDLTNAKWATALDTQVFVPSAASINPFLAYSFAVQFDQNKLCTTKTIHGACLTSHIEKVQKQLYSENALVGSETIDQSTCDQYGDKVVTPEAGCVPSSTANNVFNFSYDVGSYGSVFTRPGIVPSLLPIYQQILTYWGTESGYSYTSPRYVQPSSTNIGAQDNAYPALPYPTFIDATDRSANTSIIGKTTDNEGAISSDDTNEAPFYHSYIDAAPSASTKSRHAPNITCPEQAKPLARNTKTDIKNYLSTKIHSYYPDWGTFSNSALLWAWRMLSPNSALPDSSVGYSKAVVLMTDGLMYAPGSQTKGVLWDGLGAASDLVRTPYGYASEQKLAINPNGDNAPQKDALIARFKKVCDSMRKANIKVYVVLLNVVPGVTPKDGGIVDASDVQPYKDCASDIVNYYNTNDAATLKNAFEAIAGDLSGVRLAK